MGSIKHIFTNNIADGTNTNIVRPSDWNSAHAYTLQDGVSLAGNTSGVLAPISSGTLVLAGGNNITLSQNANSVTIQGASGGAGGGVVLYGEDQANPGNSLTFSSGSVLVADAAGGPLVFFDTAGGTQVIGISLPVPGALGVSTGGNTLGNTNVSQFKSVILVGGNNITLSQDLGGGNATITISGPNAGGAQTGISGIVGSNTTYTSGTVTFTGVGGGVTVGSNTGQRIDISVAAPVAQTNQSAIKALGVSNTGSTAGNTGVSTGIDWVFAGTNSITVSQSTAVGGPNTIWISGLTYAVPSIATNVNPVASASSIGTFNRYAPEDHRHAGVAAFAVTNTGTTAGNTRSQVGTLFLAASGGITASQSTGAAGNDTVWLSVANPVAQTAQTGISGIQVSDTTYTSGTVTFRNANGISFGSSGANGVSASYTVPTVTNSAWTVSDAATSGTVARLAFTNLNGITLSLSTGAGGSHTIVGSYTVPTQSNQTLGLYAVSNTEGASSSSTFDARTISFQGKGAVSVGFSNGSVVIDAPSAGAGNVTFSAGANSSGLASVIFSNLNGVSFGLGAGSVITASVAAAAGGGIGAGVSTGGNTAGSTGTITTGNLILVGSNAISLSQSTGAAGSNATITINAPATSSLVASNGLSLSTAGSTITLYPAPMSATYNVNSVTPAGSVQANSSVSIVPFDVNWPLAMSQVRVGVSIACGSAANLSSASQAYTLSIVLYTRNVSTLSSVWSGSQASNTFWGSNSTTVLAGARQLSVTGVATTLYPDRYWAAVHLSTTNTGTGGATTALGCTYSMIVGISQATAALDMDPWNVSTTAQSRVISHGLGLYSTNATLATIAFSDTKFSQSGNSATLANAMVNLRNWTLY